MKKKTLIAFFNPWVLLLLLGVGLVIGAATLNTLGQVDVRDFGCFPNDGVDDTACIESAVDTALGNIAPGTGSRTVVLAPGVWNIASTLDICRTPPTCTVFNAYGFVLKGMEGAILSCANLVNNGAGSYVCVRIANLAFGTYQGLQIFAASTGDGGTCTTADAEDALLEVSGSSRSRFTSITLNAFETCVAGIWVRDNPLTPFNGSGQNTFVQLLIYGGVGRSPTLVTGVGNFNSQDQFIANSLFYVNRIGTPTANTAALRFGSFPGSRMTNTDLITQEKFPIAVLLEGSSFFTVDQLWTAPTLLDPITSVIKTTGNGPIQWFGGGINMRKANQAGDPGDISGPVVDINSSATLFDGLAIVDWNDLDDTFTANTLIDIDAATNGVQIINGQFSTLGRTGSNLAELIKINGGSTHVIANNAFQNVFGTNLITIVGGNRISINGNAWGNSTGTTNGINFTGAASIVAMTGNVGFGLTTGSGNCTSCSLTTNAP